MRSSRVAAAVAVAGALTWPACEAPTPPPRPDATAECTAVEDEAVVAALAAARARWEAADIHDYVFEQSVYCYCEYTHPHPLTFHIDNDRVVQAWDAAAMPVPQEWARTVPQLFVMLEEWMAVAPDHLSACFDDDLGYPRRLSIDLDFGVADDELGYEIEIIDRR